MAGRAGRPKKKRSEIGDEEADASSIPTFCRRHGISVALYYELDPEERPEEKWVRGRKIITKEASSAWRRRPP
jgi:hypothetical protein